MACGGYGIFKSYGMKVEMEKVLNEQIVATV